MAAFQLEPIVRWLWPIPVVMFVIYPYLKRITWLCHLWLGACTGLAPLGAWLAVTGSAPWEAWALFAAQGLWVAGFDLFYSLFDLAHDRAAGLRSWATRFGERGVFTGARLFHVTAVLLLAAVGVGLGSDVFYWLGVVAVAGLLVYEHTLVRPGDLRRLDAAFFTVNGVISVVFFVFVVLATTVYAEPRRLPCGRQAEGEAGRDDRRGRPREAVRPQAGAERGLVQRPARRASCSSRGRTDRARRRSSGSSRGSLRRQKAR